MNYLVFLACVVALAYIPVALGVPYGYDPYMPYFNRGSGYFDEDYVRGRDMARGGGFGRQGSNMFYDQGENHHRATQVLEEEDHSRHNVGGGSQGSAGGGSFGRANMFDRGRLNTGRRYSNFGPRMFI